MDNLPPTNPDLKTKILEKIESKAICPRPRLLFKGQEFLLWSLWFFTVIIGALAVAVSFFVIFQHTYALYEVTHSSFWEFFVETLPFLWFLVFAVMVIFAIYNLRHTKNGYRYPLWQIFGSSLVLSLAGGGLLHLAGTGFILDKQMGKLTNYYESQEKREQKIWQQPEQGRLLGQLHATEIKDGNLAVTFADFDSVIWLTNINELDNEEVLLLQSGLKVRLLGEVINVAPPEFYVCAVLPWLHETEATKLEMMNSRQRLASKSRRYSETFADKSVDSGPCARKMHQFRIELNR